MFTISFFNFFGVSVTRNVSSLARSVLDVTRTVIIWGLGLILLKPGKNEPWEEFHFLELLGFIILIIGNFIYNEILVFPFLDLDKNTVKNLEKNKGNNAKGLL